MTDAAEPRRPALILTIPCPPSGNRMNRIRPGMKRPTRAPEYRKWLDVAGWEVRRQVVGLAPLDIRFDVEIHVPISRRDTDNWNKPLLDVCEHAGAITNDGNQNIVTTIPMQRTDCMIAFYPRADLGAIRKKTKRKKGNGGPPARTPRKRLDALYVMRSKVMF